jgi:hypothetical protein
MQFEDFDNKLRQAADQHHPNYDEKAWSKMEKLLDKHLPEKDDRNRRIIFFLLFFLLLGGGAWLISSKPWKQDKLTGSAESRHQEQTSSEPSLGSAKEETATKKQSDASLNSQHNEVPEAGNAAGEAITKEKQVHDPVTVEKMDEQPKNQHIRTAKKQVTENNFAIEVLPGSIGKKSIAEKDQPVKNQANTGQLKKETSSAENNTVVSLAVGDNKINNMRDNDSTMRQSDHSLAGDIKENKISTGQKDTAAELSPATEEKKMAKENRNKQPNSFFISLSAGPDVSSIGLDNPGKVKLLTGAGFGYTIKDKWTIRTGFYSASKIYSATPADYKPSTPLINTTYLKNIAADCKVYEVPLSLAYSFGRSVKHKTFAAAGLSSVIMKKERYNYKYVYPGGQTYYYMHKEDNKYKHYFSMLSLSGGYQRRINKTISVAAEPYVKIPLAGVGYGHVKLASAGILFSVNIIPFRAAVKK